MRLSRGYQPIVSSIGSVAEDTIGSRRLINRTSRPSLTNTAMDGFLLLLPSCPFLNPFVTNNKRARWKKKEPIHCVNRICKRRIPVSLIVTGGLGSLSLLSRKRKGTSPAQPPVTLILKTQGLTSDVVISVSTCGHFIPFPPVTSIH